MLDRLRALSYIAACTLLAGCPPPRITPLVPMPLAPANWKDALAWTRQMVRGTARRFGFDFSSRTSGDRWRGGGPPGWRHPIRSGSTTWARWAMGAGAAVVVADSTMWADPEENFRTLVPGIPMLWAALGMVRPPAPDARVETGGVAPRTIWRFIRGGDTLAYVTTDGVPRIIEAEWRQYGKVLARSRTELDRHALPAKAHVDFPEARARFDLTVVAVDTAAAIAPALWRSRR